MQDTTVCPICGKKLRTVSINTNLTFIEKIGDFSERTCTGPNHTVQFYTDKVSKSVDMLRFSLDPKYTRYFEIDYINKRSRIYCMKNSETQYIYLPKMIDPDFPDLNKLKEKISIYVTFS